MVEEIWKDIDGYEGYYMVSNLGKVKSLNYAHRGYAKDLTPKVNNRGRLWVELIRDGVKKQMLIHRLVASAFIPNDCHYPQINHIDENPKNNVVTNLEWCTQEYNNKAYRANHPGKPPIVCWCKSAKRSHLKIEQLDLCGNVVHEWKNSREIFHETGMSDWSISECCRGKRKTAYGFKWQYAT